MKPVTGRALAYVLATVFGISLTLSFAPSHAWWFTPYCLASLLILLIGSRPSYAAALGLCFGLGWFGAGLWWVFTGLYAYSDAGLLASAALTFALLLYLSIFPALAAMLISILQRVQTASWHQNAFAALAVAAAWTLCEWLRGTLFGGLPWLATGYAHSNGPLAGFAPLIGVYGLCFLNASAAALLQQCLSALNMPMQQRVKQLAAPAAMLVCLLGCGQLLLQVGWTEDTGRKMTVRLIQGNQPQQEKFSIGGLENAVTTYVSFAAASPAHLTVLPETAFPMTWNSMPENVRQTFQTIADERATAILIGTALAPDQSSRTKRPDTNSAIVLSPHAQAEKTSYRYDKEHLLPFGEYLPAGAQWLGPILNLHFSALGAGGSNQKILTLPQGKLALSICYEDLFDVALARKTNDAEAQLNISNFAWFAHSFAPEQHLQVAQMRALEAGRWFMQVSNTGMTAVIDNHGAIQDILPKNRTDALDAEIVLRDGVTPFMRYGNTPILLLSLCAVLIGGLRRYRQV
jgi:apolipoprotein N-acyltransferase